VLVENEYPVGHPELLTEFDNNDITGYFAFVKCKVLPPSDLYIPVLPIKSKGKLVFSLCGACARDQYQGDCYHNEKQRALANTWTTKELNKALELGYKIKKLYQVLRYPQKTDNMFRPYIRTWLKIKTESSVSPKNCTSETAKKAYIDEFEKREGIELDDKLLDTPNPGLRFISKLMLNSLWGKLAQKPNQTRSELISDYDPLWKILSDVRKKVTGGLMVTDDTLLLHWKYENDENDRSGNTSIAIASYVTAYARLKLYDEIAKTNKNEVSFKKGGENYNYDETFNKSVESLKKQVKLSKY